MPIAYMPLLWLELIYIFNTKADLSYFAFDHLDAIANKENMK